MNTAGLATDQAPPLAVPLGWYALVPLAMLAAGALLLCADSSPFASGWLPAAAALTHLGTLGVLGAAMAGSLYQLVPVVAGSPVKLPRLAHVAALTYAVGVACLARGLWCGDRGLLTAAAALLAAAFAAWVVPVGWALARSPVRSHTVSGLRLALLALLLAVAVGLRLAWGHATGALPATRQVLLALHLQLALLGWVGGLLGAVAWQIVPMFWLTSSFSAGHCRAYLWAVAVSAAAASVAGLQGANPTVLAVAALPAATMVWLVQPWRMMQLLAARRRKRADPSLRLWLVSVVAAPLVFLSAGVWLASPWPPLGPLFGWLAIWCWAGAAVHAALTKIVPFLWWFHGFARTAADPVAQARVPPMKLLWPDRLTNLQFGCHVAAAVLGVAAVLSGSPLLTGLTGVAVTATGLALAVGMAAAWWRMRQALRSS